MSNFLLQKSFKLFEDNNQSNKPKKSKLHKIKKKKNWIAIKKNKEKELEQNLLKNLEIIKKLNGKCSFDVPEEVLSYQLINAKDIQDLDVKKDEPTVFTEKDFEEFEKEYLNS